VVKVGSCLQSVIWVGIHNARIGYSTVVAIRVVWERNGRKSVKQA